MHEYRDSCEVMKHKNKKYYVFLFKTLNQNLKHKTQNL